MACLATARAAVLALLVASLLLSCATPPVDSGGPDQGSFSRPNLLFTLERVSQVKAAIHAGDDLLASALRDLETTAESLLGHTPKPIVGAFRVPGFYTQAREEHRRVNARVRPDAKAANALALAYAFTGEPRYAEKAREILFAWATVCTHPAHGAPWWWVFVPWRNHRGDTQLVVTYAFPNFLFAFDILSKQGFLSENDVAFYLRWLEPFVRYASRSILYKNNHHAFQVLFLLSAAHVRRDPAMFHGAVQSYRRAFRRQVGSDGRLPRELWRRKKSGTYTLMALEAMLQSVVIAERHGYTGLRDTRSVAGATLKDAVSFYSDYLDDPGSWARHTNAPNLNAPATLGRWGWLFEIPYRWWREERYRRYMHEEPYAFSPPRSYTSEFMTLLFRPSS
jgi:hypothetical protein